MRVPKMAALGLLALLAASPVASQGVGTIENPSDDHNYVDTSGAGALGETSQPTGLPATAAALIPALERATGMPIVILQRTGDDPGQFWYLASQALCAKTGDNWCEDDLQVLSDTTNLLGWSRVLTYQPNASGQPGVAVGSGTKSVCVILPPKPGVSAGFVSIGLSGGGSYSYMDLPTDAEAEAYLYLMHAGGCQATGADPAADQKRSDTFAALALTLIEGSPGFVTGTGVSPARKFAAFRNGEAVGWSASVGERVLLDLWKGQASQALNAAGCNVSVEASTSIDTQAITRSSGLGLSNCSGNNRFGTVTDGNLGLWGARGVPMPPSAYTPFMGFGSPDEGMKYAWTTATSIASQR